MRYLDEYRDHVASETLLTAIKKITTRRWSIMEVCGGQTHSIVKYGIDALLPEQIELLHGPGCPVCVTPLETIDKAHVIASHPQVIFCSFGDMLRVPGSRNNLLQLKAEGKDIRIIYSPLDAVEIAAKHPDKEVVLFAIGFETTAPPNAMAVWTAQQRQCNNFSVLVSHVLVPPAISSILETTTNRVQAFLGPGHVCSIMGYEEYEQITRRYRLPIVITGFEPLDLLEGLFLAIRQLERGEAQLENQYSRAVKKDGNTKSHELIGKIFEICDRNWRGMGCIPKSGLRLRPEFRKFDAEYRFDLKGAEPREQPLCMSGLILKGLKKPHDCPAFGTVCTPQTPLGATMVSSEGACAAYFHNGRRAKDSQK